VALWRQIAEDLETEIFAGKLAAGMRLPTENELADRYAVNRHTLRRALAELGRKGLVEATPRRGTFVSKSRIPYRISRQTRFSENILDAGRDPGGRLLNTRIGTAPEEMAEWLGIAQAAAVVEMNIVRVANEVPICLATTWLPADRFSRIAKVYQHVGSMTKAFARLGIKNYSRKRTRITSRLATSDERAILEVPRGAVVMLIESLDIDTTGEPISASHARFVSERVELLFEY
jgi:GntR family transcriptional regulator, phosphonate transport system regulatory protein